MPSKSILQHYQITVSILEKTAFVIIRDEIAAAVEIADEWINKKR